jgi:hypothetical protein
MGAVQRTWNEPRDGPSTAAVHDDRRSDSRARRISGDRRQLVLGFEIGYATQDSLILWWVVLVPGLWKIGENNGT